MSELQQGCLHPERLVIGNPLNPDYMRTKNNSKPLRRSATKFLFQFIQRISRFFLQLIWGFIWRSSLIVITGISLGVSYYYLDMKEFDSLLDERSRGSVTLENNTGEDFAWRGDNITKKINANNI